MDALSSAPHSPLAGPVEGRHLRRAADLERLAREAGTAAAPGRAEALAAAADRFEGFFAFLLVRQMRKTLQEDPYFGGGQEQDVFQQMLDEQYANAVARKGDLGIARALVSRLARVAGPREAAAAYKAGATRPPETTP
ncbi:MAG: rod-binding protein [Planctomycetes bacterium]|nr:rod-binding protein [Planctomycetota bacterium]